MKRLVSIDPAFKKNAIVVIDQSFHILYDNNIDFTADYDKKNGNALKYTIALWSAIKKIIKEIDDKFKPDVYVIENQIGKFAST